MVAPKERWSDDGVVRAARRVAETTGARVMHTTDLGVGIHGVDFLYGDVWLTSRYPMETWNERIAQLAPYQITMDVVRATGNADVKVMHRLPATRARRSVLAERIFERSGVDAVEITEEVFESPNAIMFDQVENRMHAIKAVMVATIWD